MLRKNHRCLCKDPNCPICKGKCHKRAKFVVYCLDMEDKTGTPMCEECTDDAMYSGIFDYEPIHPTKP